MQAIQIFPVRHHSPASSLLVGEWIQQVAPELILIEGPSDANQFIEILTDDDTDPPVAILSYYLPKEDAAEPHYIMYPFAKYSPEYVALQQAKIRKIPARFVDIPSSIAIRFYDRYEQMLGDDTLFEKLAERFDCRSFEEFWERSFENGGMTVNEFRQAMLEYAGFLRLQSEQQESEALPKDRLREQFMRQEVLRAMAEGYQPDKILLVCGAFHAAAFASAADDAPQDASLPEALAVELTVIPYSYPRLSEQLGYGAGNRAPLYYENVYKHQGDFGAASLETMVAFMNHLYFKGYSVSLANVIEANRLAKILAKMRAKRAPGLEEIREALTTCLLHGASDVVDQFLKDLFIGRAVGRVSSKIGKTSLQQEFYREINQRKIPLSDSPQEFILHRHNPIEIGTSIFLHRLRLCQIPFAQNKTVVVSAYSYLSQTSEKWEVQWTPAVDAGLVEKSLLGNSFVEVCARTLSERLKTAQNAHDSAEVLLEIAVCDIKGLFQKALSACDFLAAEDNDFYSLTKAGQNLHALISYISSRETNSADVPVILTRMFNRAVLILPAAANVSDDGVEPVCEGIKILRELCTYSPHVNKELWYATLPGVIDSYTAHPKIAGLAASIAYFAKAMNDDDLIPRLNQRLSAGNAPINGAWFVDGFLTLTKIVLVRNRAVVQILDSFIQSIRPEDFVTTLPVLRRAFSELSKSELNYFIEQLSAVHKIAQAQAAKDVIEGQAEKLKDLNQFSQGLEDLF